MEWRQEMANSVASAAEVSETRLILAGAVKGLQRRAHRNPQGYRAVVEGSAGHTAVVVVTVFIFGVFFLLSITYCRRAFPTCTVLSGTKSERSTGV